tara:strand:- start:14 stop:235 length:222 start_codon:yes stop_codon:yes gene_type:complete
MADLYKLINGTEKVKLTDDEKAQREADIQSAKEIEENKAASEKNTSDLKASAKAKLIAGEALTEDEANILTGI